ncbi:MAG: recombinase family protein [Armatimonadota bacterium]
MIQLPVALYVRVSSDRQKEANTIEGQIQALVAYCEREGVVPVDIYRDEGFSGDLPFLQRPDGARLLTDAKAGKFATVLVYMFDRLSRDTYEGLATARMLKESGVSPYSLLEPFDITTPHGAYMFVNSLNNAQLFKAQFLERTKAGSRRKARAGAWVGGPPPYGYRVEGRGKNETLHLVVNDDEEVAEGIGMTEGGVVRWVFHLCVNGQTCYKIAQMMNARGIPTRQSNPRPTWHPASISRILNSTVYKGIHPFGRYNRTTGYNPPEQIIERPCPAIVSVDDWDKAQETLTRNRQLSRRDTDTKYLLRGLVHCELCGAKFGGQKWHTRRYPGNFVYICRSTVLPLSEYALGKKVEGLRCAAGILPGSVEDSIWNDVLDILDNPEKAAKRAADAAEQAAPKEDADALHSELKKTKSAIESKEGERAAVLSVFRRGRITTAALDAQLDEIDREETLLKAAQTRLMEQLEGMQAPGETEESVISYLRALKARLHAAELENGAFTWETKRDIIECMVARISVHSSGPPSGKRRGIPTVEILYSYGGNVSVRKKKPL